MKNPALGSYMLVGSGVAFQPCLLSLFPFFKRFPLQYALDHTMLVRYNYLPRH